jgi:hypothetical protein
MDHKKILSQVKNKDLKINKYYAILIQSSHKYNFNEKQYFTLVDIGRYKEIKVIGLILPCHSEHNE